MLTTEDIKDLHELKNFADKSIDQWREAETIIELIDKIFKLNNELIELQKPREERMIVVDVDNQGVPTVWCDPEISNIVTALNKNGIKTIASCSGHGYRPGFISLENNIELFIVTTNEMKELEKLWAFDINGNKVI